MVAAFGYDALAGGSLQARGYDEWIRVSVLIVGNAHIALAVCAFLFARRLHRSSLEEMHCRFHALWLKALGITVLVSAAPGVLLLAIPPVLTFVTGIAFVPGLF